MSKITFEDKVDIRTTTLPRKNYVGAEDINEIKSAVNNVALLTHEVTLTKAQLNTIFDDGGVVIPLSDFGCQAGEDVNIIQEYSLVEVFRDGVDFNSTSNSLDLVKSGGPVSAIAREIVETTVDSKYSKGLKGFLYYPYDESSITIECRSNVTGGGSNAFIKIKFYYQIITA